MRAVAGFLCGAWLLLGVIPEDSATNVQLFSCGFEADFCAMTQRADDYFDWTRQSGGTVTVETGPSSAYSGTFYIYIEATDVSPRSAAEVETGSLQHSGTACVTFAYHMYGIGVGFLTVTSTSSREIWRAFIDQGDHWRLGTAEVGLRPEDRVSFRAETSSDSRGDIALDDIVIREGGCRTTEPLPFSCSFEKGFCGMLQRYDDHFDWTRFDRSTDTGPQEAANGTWFIYIETDHPRVNGDVAIIETPSIDFTGHICVRFKYCMSGYYVGVLRVHLVNVGTERHIFRLEGDQGSEWQAAEINVTEIHSGDWLRFTGYRGLEPRDIGVDDVLISPGWCNDLNECTGSTHGCSDGCQNTLGSYRCTCPDGKLLDVDGVSCSDSQGQSQVIVAVTVVVLAVIAFAVGVVVYIKRRKKVSQAQEQAVPTASPGDVTEPADVATYEEVGGPQPAKVNTSAIQMSPLRLDGAVPDPPEYLNLDLCERPSTASYVNVPTGVHYENHAALLTRPAGDVTEPADGAAYDDVGGPGQVTARAAQIQMSSPQSDPEDPNPGGYEHLEPYEPPVGGPYDVIM